MFETTRYCPVCERYTSKDTCAEHRIGTLPVDPSYTQPADLLPGTIIGQRFRIEAVIGRGAFATVYRAKRTTLETTVALKVLRHDDAGDPVSLARFVQEARTAADLDHPNIVKVIDIDVDIHQGAVFLAMEHLDGRSLRTILDEEGPLAAERVYRLLAQVAKGLAEAHAVGVVHRDLKPANIMVTRTLSDDTERARILDFGVAKLMDGAGTKATITRRGLAVGTPAYMSPEQATAEPVDGRADLYALGCLLHECLTGQLPFAGDTPMQAMQMHLSHQPPALDERFGAGAIALHATLLAKERDDRPASAGDVAGRFERLATGSPRDIPPRRVGETVRTPAATLQDELPSVRATIVPVSTDVLPTKGSPRRAWAAVIALAIVLVAGLSLTANRSGSEPTGAAVGPSPPQVERVEAPSVAPAAVQIFVDSDPAHAKVRLDGREVGLAPTTIVLQRDGEAHDLTVEKVGHRVYRQRIVADREHTVRVVLEATPPKPGPKARRPELPPIKTER